MKKKRKREHVCNTHMHRMCKTLYDSIGHGDNNNTTNWHKKNSITNTMTRCKKYEYDLQLMFILSVSFYIRFIYWVLCKQMKRPLEILDTKKNILMFLLHFIQSTSIYTMLYYAIILNWNWWVHSLDVGHC